MSNVKHVLCDELHLEFTLHGHSMETDFTKKLPIDKLIKSNCKNVSEKKC